MQNFCLFNRPFLPVLLAFALGIWLGGRPWLLANVPVYAVIALALVFFVLCVVQLKRRQTTLFLPLLLFCLLGYLAITPYLNPRLTPNHILNYVNNSKYTVTGLVLTNPEINHGRQSFVVGVKTLTDASGQTHAVKGNINVNYGETAINVPYGAAIEFKGYLREIHSFKNPGGFDYERFMLLKRVYANLYVNPGNLHVYDPVAHGGAFVKGLYRFKAYAAGLIADNVNGPAKGVLEALLTGGRRNIEPEVTNAFSKTGLSHVLAISGLHVGIVSLCFCLIFMLALRLVPWLKQDYRRRGAALMLALAPVFIYCVFSGFAPSTKRAFIVMVIFIMGFASLRTQDSFNSAVTAALLILVVFPQSLYSVSFQLSFAAILGIIYGYRVLNAANFLPRLATVLGLSGLRQNRPGLYCVLSGVYYWVVSCFFMSLCHATSDFGTREIVGLGGKC